MLQTHNIPDKPRLCRIITGSTIKIFINNILAEQKSADMLELRSDFINNLTLSDVRIIQNVIKIPAIFTCRSANDGGHFSQPEKFRIAILQEALLSKYAYVDIEASVLMQTKVKSKYAQVIASYHNFIETPSQSSLKKIINDIGGTSAHIIKIATKTNTLNDVHNLLNILINNENKPIIVIGMGDIGRITRIITALFIPHIFYVTTGHNTIAPGQLSEKEAKILSNLLHLSQV
jgi:3-dehydroquinate dehydratase I